jgi:hypothetical protein
MEAHSTGRGESAPAGLVTLVTSAGRLTFHGTLQACRSSARDSWSDVRPRKSAWNPVQVSACRSASLVAASIMIDAAASGVLDGPASASAETSASANSTASWSGLARRAGALGSSKGVGGRDRLTGPAELIGDLVLGDIRGLGDAPGLVHVHIQAALLEPVVGLGENLGLAQDLLKLAVRHARERRACRDAGGTKPATRPPASFSECHSSSLPTLTWPRTFCGASARTIMLRALPTSSTLSTARAHATRTGRGAAFSAARSIAPPNHALVGAAQRPGKASDIGFRFGIRAGKVAAHCPDS